MAAAKPIWRCASRPFAVVGATVGVESNRDLGRSLLCKISSMFLDGFFGEDRVYGTPTVAALQFPMEPHIIFARSSSRIQ